MGAYFLNPAIPDPKEFWAAPGPGRNPHPESPGSAWASPGPWLRFPRGLDLQASPGPCRASPGPSPEPVRARIPENRGPAFLIFKFVNKLKKFVFLNRFVRARFRENRGPAF